MQDLDVTQWRIDELKITPKQKKKTKRIENEGVHRLASQVNEGMAVKLMEDLHTSTHETHDIQLRDTCWNRKKKILLLLSPQLYYPTYRTTRLCDFCLFQLIIHVPT